MARTHSSRRRRQDICPTHPDAAAIDIGATMHVAAVGPGQGPRDGAQLWYLHGASCSGWLTGSQNADLDRSHGVPPGSTGSRPSRSSTNAASRSSFAPCPPARMNNPG